MSSTPTLNASTRSGLRRWALGSAVFVFVLVALASCVNEPTAPREPGIRYASGLRFNAIFPSLLQQPGAADLVAFDRVHVVLHHSDRTVALDTTIAFPANANEISLALNVRLLAGAPTTGELMTLDLAYLNAANETVFRGGPVTITAIPTLPGQAPPAPISIPVVYSGPGAAATAVRVSPRTISVNAGGAFSFTAVAVDATGTAVPNTPVFWTSLDVTRATIAIPTAGSGSALGLRGTARLVAALITGKADTVTVDVQPVPSALASVSGTGQSGIIGKPTATTLAQPLVVRVTATDGLPVAGVAVSFGVTGGGGSVNPGVATTDASGLAQASWTLGQTAGTQTVTASSSGLTGSPVTFTATGQASVATKLIMTSSPAAAANIAAGSTMTFVVAARDVDGDPVASFTGNVTLSFVTSPSLATLGGTTTVAAVGGVATFSNVTIGTPATGYVIAASAAGLTGVSSPAFNIVTGPATNMVLVTGGAQTAAAGAALAPITVALTDASGNAKVNVPVDFAVTTGAGSVQPARVNTDAGGRATATWTLGPSAGTQTLGVSSLGVATLSVSATATSTISHWVVTTQPAATQTAGVVFTPTVTAELRDPANALVTTFNGPVTVTSGLSGAPVTGTTTVNAASGVVSFSTISANVAQQGYTLVIGSTGAVAATSNAFDVVAGPAAVIALQSGGNQTANFGTALAQAIVAKVTDTQGNAITGRSVQFAVANGGGSVTPASASTNAAGTASTSWTLGAGGAQSLTITSTGLTGSPITVTATGGTGPAPLATTTVTPRLDTLTSFTDTRQLAVAGRDAGGTLVSGTWTWVSRNAAAATVNASGLVTSVANGSAYIVATETGGTKDSALIVVQQRIASVTVNPSSRSLYPTGTFTFTAQAVDGRNVPMTSQPAFAWSSVTPSVASINAASGVATGVTIGSTQVRATSGSTVGVSQLTVLTPITRVDVSFDSTNAPAPDNFTMTALGQARLYRALARDTLLNPMTGITFAWGSTNGSVAAIDSTTPTQGRATAAANGVTSIQASAQGVTGSATLTVAQVLASVELTPPTATVGITGTTSMIARGKDANGRYISGGSFTFASGTPSVATINATTGVVTGVSIGSSNITATSGSITSNASVVSVNNSGPAIISFGRDTLGIGRGSSNSVPIFLSKPSASTVTINLAVADTFAFWSPASVSIPSGQTAVNATLNGRNAGTTRIFAVDGSGTGYAPDTAVLAVQANLRMTTTSYSMNATDQVSTQALLSDPSPAGGTYVTFSYGTSGVASLSPDPAFIPAGQLAADVVIRGLAAGATTITPSATGVTGNSATVFVAAAYLNLVPVNLRLGAGQYDSFGSYVSVTYQVRSPFVVTLTSSDTSVATTKPSSPLPGYGSNVDYFDIHAQARGTARIIGSAQGWRPDTIFVTSTTPKVLITGGGTRNVTSPVSNVTIYAADSLRSTHSRTNSLAVRVSSSDTTVMRVLDTVVTIAADGSSISARVIPGGVGGTAYIRTSASGHTADSVLYTIIGPALTLNYVTNRIGLDQEQVVSVYIPNSIATPLAISLVMSDSTKVATIPSVTMPAGNTNTSFTLRAKGLGSSALIAAAAGYAPGTGTTIVTTPRIRLNGGFTLNGYQTSSTNFTTRDSVSGVHVRSTPLTVTLTSTDTTVLTVDTLITVAAGSASGSPSAVIVAGNPGTARIIATAPGHFPDTAIFTVQAAKLNLNWTTFLIGARQHTGPQDFYVQTPTTRTVPVTVTLTQKQPAKLALTATTLTLPANQSYQYVVFAGLAPGLDTVIASAPGYLPDTGFVTVTTPKLRISGFATTAQTTTPPQQIDLYTSDSTSNNVHDAMVVRAVSSDSNVVRPAVPFFRILKNTYYATTSVIYTGPGTATITYSDSANSGYLPVTTPAVTVTGPTLLISGQNPGSLGMRQTTGPNDYYVYLQNSVTNPLTVNLLSTGTRVATVPATVTIPANQNYGYFTITAQDTLGTIQIQATATGYTAASVNMQVTVPRFRFSTNTTSNTTSGPRPIYVYVEDTRGQTHYAAENVTVTLTSSAPGVAAIDSATVTIPAGQSSSGGASWSPGATGTAQLSASDPRTAFYKYTSGTQGVSVVTPTPNLYFNGLQLAVGQYSDEYVYLPDVASAPVVVPISHAAAPRTNTPASVTVPQGNSAAVFRVTATSLGTDTITVSPPGHNTAKAVVIVGLGRLTDYSSIPASLRAGDSVQVSMYILDPSQSTRNVAAATVLTLAPNANIEFRSGGASSAVITSVTVPANQYFVSFWIKGVTVGTGTASISNVNYQTYTNNTVSVTP